VDFVGGVNIRTWVTQVILLYWFFGGIIQEILHWNSW
jgi:hypothetical protein